MTAISVRSVTKDFGAVRAVHDVSFEVPYGSVTGFIGANGSGKTTTMRMMIGLIRPTSGEALLDGHRFVDLVEPRRSVGAVVDRVGAHPGQSGRQHLTTIAMASGLSLDRVDECLDEVGLLDAADRPIQQYSMGMTQRCALAVALLGNPQILVLDEPSNGLDPSGIRWLRELMRGWADEGRAVLVSTHQLAELSVIVDHLVVIDRGTVVFHGPSADLRGADASLEDAVFELVAEHSRKEHSRAERSASGGPSVSVAAS